MIFDVNISIQCLLSCWFSPLPSPSSQSPLLSSLSWSVTILFLIYNVYISVHCSSSPQFLPLPSLVENNAGSLSPYSSASRPYFLKIQNCKLSQNLDFPGRRSFFLIRMKTAPSQTCCSHHPQFVYRKQFFWLRHFIKIL